MSSQAMLLPPGFRFHPTDEELILHYLSNRAASLPCPVSIIAEVDIYKFDPWDLPAKAIFGDREWYFFSPRDRKYPNGVRPNRSAGSGYWKATGTDKPVVTSKGNENIGTKKALVFYKGRPPKGVKSDWIMHEYRLTYERSKNTHKPAKALRDDSSMRLDDWVLCRIYRKISRQDTDKDLTVEDDVFIPAPPSAAEHESNLVLPKSYSLSELLNAVDYSEISRLLETPALENNSFATINSNEEFNNGSNYSSDSSFPPLFHIESSALLTEGNPLKRQWARNDCFEEGIEGSPTEKKPNLSTFDTNIDNKFNFTSQPFLNHQLISNSHFF
ncbi:hypothetical protein Cni_G26825 [Canna indica]|uniref:NAC domain-containing protein n=1 Tax=Canna indica TaxID=4628 RepID=A0AAQ3L6V3_9LILI|nr:hypothetical protein Cni_G26825 [Canna indica]